VAKCILVLEDNDDRRAAMEKWLADRLYMYEAVLTDDPGECVTLIGKCRDNILTVSLDHDLHERRDHSTELTGMLVVDFLVKMPPEFPVLLHTSNQPDGERMRSRLTRSGWSVDWVTPFDDTNWVGLSWYPALKRAIRKTARRAPPSPADDRD
jgi:CheY-like chemotaxis protein